MRGIGRMTYPARRLVRPGRPPPAAPAEPNAAMKHFAHTTQILPRPASREAPMTTLVPPPSTTETDDGAAIAELHRLHAVQRKAFLADPCPAPAERKEMLGALAGMVLGHRDQIRAAMSEDFGAHPDLF